MSKFIKQLAVTFIGLVICGVGVGIFLYANLGVDPASVFQTGLSKVFNISYGTSSALSNLMILAIIFVIDKKYISVASILAIFSIGYSADITSKVLSFALIGDYSFIVKTILCIIGTIIMASGVAVYTRANLGVGAVDSVSEIIHDKTGVSYRIIRIVADLSFVVIGYMLGGALGIGTIIAAFLTGPCVQLIRKYSNGVIDGIIG